MGFHLCMKKNSILAVLLFFCFLFAVKTLAQSNNNSLALNNVTIIDATGNRPQKEMTVIISNGRISAIGKTKKLKVPANTQIIDASGKYLIPGLWDMHTHIWDKDFIPAYIANGITGVRDMGGALDAWSKWRTEFETGTTLGPRSIFSGRIIDGYKPFFYIFLEAKNAQNGREIVNNLKQKNVDFIKVYDRLPKETYLAVVDEAKKLNLPFAGHIPVDVKASEASELGQKSIEHLTGIALESSTEEENLRNEALKTLKELYQEGLKPDEVTAKFNRFYELSRTIPLETFDKKKAQKLFSTFRKNNTWQVPTIVVRDDVGDETIRQSVESNLKYFPPIIRGNILRDNKTTKEEQLKNKQKFQKTLEIIKLMHKAGIKFLAGADSPNPYSVPGFGLHEELELLVKAGFTPLEALQTATRNPAEYLGKLDSLGTIETGKIADFVLLEANPLTDIKNTRKIAAVILNGKFVDKKQLQDLLNQMEAKANNKPN
jgi:imidazolonepropionase-like amidohydrolase